MKILHVLPALTKGGGERVAVELANFASREGHEVTMLSAYATDPTLLQNNLHPEVKVLFVSETSTNPYLKILLWLRSHWSFIAKQDIIHSHLTYGSIVSSLIKFIRNFTPGTRPLVVETYHAVGMPIPPIHQKIHTLLAKQRDAFVVMAEDDYWHSFRLKNHKLITRLIPNGISISPKKYSEQELLVYKKKIGIPNNCKVIIGTIGMLRPDRQPTRYIPIFAEVAKQVKDVHFFIGGDGPELHQIQSLIAEYQLEERVHLGGLLIDTSIAFSIVDIYISLSVGSITGVSMLEAALHKKPVVGIQVLNNYKCKESDWVWSSFKDNEIVEKLIDLSGSISVRKALEEQQYNYVQKTHTTEAMGAAYLELYKELQQESK